MVQAGEDVTFIDPWPAHVEHMRKHGLRVTHAMDVPEFCVPVRALHVTDAQAARAHCRAHGLAVEETVRIPNADRFFIRDPDGNRIEIIQWFQPYDPTARGGRRGRPAQ